MQAVIDYLTQHPLHAAAAVLLLIFLLVSLAKKMFKVAILVVVLNVAYGYYLHEIAKEAYAAAKSSYKETRESAQELLDEAGDLIK